MFSYRIRCACGGARDARRLRVGTAAGTWAGRIVPLAFPQAEADAALAAAAAAVGGSFRAD
jgi:hypothetical protein